MISKSTPLQSPILMIYAIFFLINFKFLIFEYLPNYLLLKLSYLNNFKRILKVI